MENSATPKRYVATCVRVAAKPSMLVRDGTRSSHERVVCNGRGGRASKAKARLVDRNVVGLVAPYLGR